MPKSIVMDEFHVTIVAPPNLRATEYNAIRRRLDDAQFQADLRRAVRDVFRRHPDLRKLRAHLTR
jgi:hypothetical protein